MGLFDFLEKKNCDVCGNKIGLLGNRKLEDGNLCKDCAAKLSPWFTGRRHAALADIRQQLASREENRCKVGAFHCTQKYGNAFRSLYIDRDAGNFTICTESDLSSGNPDILPLSCITAVKPEQTEHKTELRFKDKDGNMVSYNPKQYEYAYDFYMTVSVDHPYIDDMRFSLNPSAIKKTALSASLQADIQLKRYLDLQDEIAAALKEQPRAAAIPEAITYPFSVTMIVPCGLETFTETASGTATAVIVNREYYERWVIQGGKDLSEAIKPAIEKAVYELIKAGMPLKKLEETPTMLIPSVLATVSALHTPWGLSYRAMDITLQDAETEKPALAPNEWICPGCSAKNTGGKFCEYCGTARPE